MPFQAQNTAVVTYLITHNHIQNLDLSSKVCWTKGKLTYGQTYGTEVDNLQLVNGNVLTYELWLQV